MEVMLPSKSNGDDEDEDDILVFSERPNEQIPVPHQMTTISKSLITSKLFNSIEVTNKETLFQVESSTAFIEPDEDCFKTYFKEKKMQPDKEDTPDMKTKISTPQFEEKLETPDSYDVIDRGDGGYKEWYFNNDSPIDTKQNKIIRDNSEFEFTINPKSENEPKLDSKRQSNTKLPAVGVVEVEVENHNESKITDNEEFGNFVEVEEQFDDKCFNERNAIVWIFGTFDGEKWVEGGDDKGSKKHK